MRDEGVAGVWMRDEGGDAARGGFRSSDASKRGGFGWEQTGEAETPVPALKMKLWHVPVLELPVSGCVMKGATLLGVVSDHPMLRSVVVSDGSKQGRLSMRTGQVEDLRSNLTSAAQLNSSPSPDRTPVPALKMKLWHVPVLELPVSGCVMKGATLLVIRPVYGSNVAERDGDLVGRVWDGEEEVKEAETMMFGEAAREMMKNKKAYTLEMNSF
ncbi:hypothetical protein U1Q18_044056 [Sarracenia purpurea var. burkii]